MAAAALLTAEKELFTEIGLPAVKALYAEVLWVIEAAFVPDVHGTMELHFLGERGRVLAEEFSDILERTPFIERGSDIFPVSESEMFLISQD